jgi:glycerol uptake facilitator-like aquaporin
MSLAHRLLSEFVATALLLTIVIGSGIMGERLSDGNVAIALLANSLATVGGLYMLIEIFGPVSAHMNPAVSLVLALRRELPATALPPYVIAQLAGAACGAWLAHAMFDLPILQWSDKLRTGSGQWIAEAVATAGLILVVLRAPAGRVAILVAAYIGAAYWFSDSFAGIAPASVAGFVAAQLLGAALGLGLHHVLGRAPVATMEMQG